MFTGLITATGTLHSLGDHELVIECAQLREQPGGSVSVDGACLTVVSCRDGRVAFDLLPATVQRTRLSTLAPGDRVNLEPALRVGEPMGGHWVQGHVDAVGQVLDVSDAGASLDLTIAAPAEVLDYCIERGSIAVNGVSLTVMRLGAGSFGVSLIPETRARTNLGDMAVGTSVNLEADVLARYVGRLLANQHLPAPPVS